MSDTMLCTEGEIALSEKLHTEFARAEVARREAQPRVDQAASAYEDACLHRHAAGALCDNVPQDRIAALDGEVIRTRSERDRAFARAEEPYQRAKLAMIDFDQHFADAAANWLGCILRDYATADERLVALCQPVRRKLTEMVGARTSLRDIRATFAPVFAEVSAWKLLPVTPRYGVHPPERFSPPRLSDFLER